MGGYPERHGSQNHARNHALAVSQLYGILPPLVQLSHSSTKKAAQVSGARFVAIPVSAANDYALTGADVGDAWVHVDAAYAGAALVCPEYRDLTAQFHRFHSFNMNMHKWLLTNFDCSVTFVQQRKHYIDAFSMTPPYLRNIFSESGRVTDYRD